MVSCSLRGDLGDLGDTVEVGESFAPDGDFIERVRNEDMQEGDLNCSKTRSSDSSDFGKSGNGRSGKIFFFFSGERITGCERCFFDGDPTCSFFSLDSIDLFKSEYFVFD